MVGIKQPVFGGTIFLSFVCGIKRAGFAIIAAIKNGSIGIKSCPRSPRQRPYPLKPPVLAGRLKWLCFAKDGEAEKGRRVLLPANAIKSYIVRSGCTMQEVVDLLHDEHGWSDSVSNLSNKLQRESLRYTETVQLADALGYEIVWQRRK